MADRLSEKYDGWTYSTRDNHQTGLEPAPVQITDNRVVLHFIQVTLPLTTPVPCWVHLFDRDGESPPQGGEVADIPGPVILVAGGMAEFTPVPERDVPFYGDEESKGCMKDDSWEPKKAPGIREGYPFDRAVVAVISSTPIVFTPFAGAQNACNVVARGRNR